MVTEQSVNDIARVILDNWDDWEAIAGQDAQQAQTPQAWRETMLRNITDTIWMGLINGEETNAKRNRLPVRASGDSQQVRR
jgi:hypothetical protein